MSCTGGCGRSQPHLTTAAAIKVLTNRRQHHITAPLVDLLKLNGGRCHICGFLLARNPQPVSDSLVASIPYDLVRAMQRTVRGTERQHTCVRLLMPRDGENVTPVQICGLGGAGVPVRCFQDSHALTLHNRSGILKKIRCGSVAATAC